VRGVLAGTLTVLLLGSASASSAGTASDKTAYDAAMQCFIANGVEKGNRRDVGDAKGAAAFEAKAREDFDIAVTLGKTLGFSGNRINQDFGMAQADQLPKLVKDRAYFERTAATCRQLGLM